MRVLVCGCASSVAGKVINVYRNIRQIHPQDATVTTETLLPVKVGRDDNSGYICKRCNQPAPVIWLKKPEQFGALYVKRTCACSCHAPEVTLIKE